jgi:hypothetical protein
MAEKDDLPYQQVPQVEQLRRERANAEAYGQTDRVAAVDKQLRGFGVEVERKAAGEKRKAAAEEADDEGEARRTPPQGRQSAAQARQKT